MGQQKSRSHEREKVEKHGYSEPAQKQTSECKKKISQLEKTVEEQKNRRSHKRKKEREKTGEGEMQQFKRKEKTDPG